LNLKTEVIKKVIYYNEFWTETRQNKSVSNIGADTDHGKVVISQGRIVHKVVLSNSLKIGDKSGKFLTKSGFSHGHYLH